jgi:hypothetical protein
MLYRFNNVKFSVELDCKCTSRILRIIIYVDNCLMGYDAVWSHKLRNLRTFWKNQLPPSSWQRVTALSSSIAYDPLPISLIIFSCVLLLYPEDGRRWSP